MLPMLMTELAIDEKTIERIAFCEKVIASIIIPHFYASRDGQWEIEDHLQAQSWSGFPF